VDAASSIHREIVVDADAATVFAFFTDPERLIRRIGVSANLNPKPGGLLLIDVVDGFVARGEFTEVVPVSRLAYTWGWEGNKENVPPGSSLVEIDLSPQNGGTLVCFNHSGLPPQAVPGHADGWKHYLGRLALVASGIDPGPDPRLMLQPD
jgi:uncharacterized protein YndB with AHSA1/START domain